MHKYLAVPALMLCLMAGVACTSDEPADTPSPTPTATSSTPTSTATATPSTGTPAGSPSATATGSPTPSATGTAAPGAPSTPTDLALAGRLPDLSATVPPGEGEAGRLTLSWEGGTGAEGFRIYLKDCDGTQSKALDVPATDHQYGPIHVCRPSGNIGVSAFNASGESAIAWVR